MNKDAKAERLAAALRENLKRRKAQTRGRKDSAAEVRDGIEPATVTGSTPQNETKD